MSKKSKVIGKRAYEKALFDLQLELVKLQAWVKHKGLDSQRFSRDLIADTTQQKLMEEIQLSRDLHVDSFPAIVFKLGESVWPIAIDYLDAAPMLELIEILKEGET